MYSPSLSRRRILLASALISALLATQVSVVATAQASDKPATVEASGTFSFTTNPGILTTWQTSDIALIGISPGSVITSAAGLSARIVLPVVAKTGSANATAGGFRLMNVTTGRSVRCQVPTVDTRARQVDCVFADGTSRPMFIITEIADRFKVSDSDSVTTFFRGIDLSIADSASAASLNDALSTNVFSASVSVARGFLDVTRAQ